MPASVSSLAAHDPQAPEPTTMASYSELLLRISACLTRCLRVVPAIRCRPCPQPTALNRQACFQLFLESAGLTGAERYTTMTDTVPRIVLVQSTRRIDQLTRRVRANSSTRSAVVATLSAGVVTWVASLRA